MSLYVLWLGWGQPILEMHSFRQTQTALTTYWLMQGGNWIAYETPVLGSPWAIPMELPVYQWLVALIASISGAKLEVIGRLISYLFFLLCLWPLHSIFKHLRLSNDAFIVTAGLTLMAPIYLFWSRTFMIESTALLFSLSFLALYLRWIEKGSYPAAIGAMAFAALALLTKVTTAIPYGLLAAALTLAPTFSWIQHRQWSDLAARAAVAALIAGVALLLLMAWVQYSDGMKENNLIAGGLTSHGLRKWNFGSLDQRISVELWRNIIGGRAIPEALGSVGVFAFVLGMSLSVLANRASSSAWLFGLAWLSAFLIFTNLHIVHNYYQYANAILIIAAVSVLISEAANTRPFLAASIIAITMSLQWLTFDGVYRSATSRDLSEAKTLRVAEFIKNHTPKDSAIIVFGYDWSSEVAFYSQRKSLTVPSWLPHEKLKKLLADPASGVSPLALSAVVQCRETTSAILQESIDAMLQSLSIKHFERIDDCEISLLSGGLKQ